MRNPNEVAKLLKQRQTLKTIATGFKLVGQYEMAIAQYQTALKVEVTPNSGPVLMLGVDKKYLDPESASIFFEIAECKRLNKDYIQAYRDFQKLQSLRSPVANVVDKIKQCELEITEHADKIFMQARNMLASNESTAEIKLQIEQCKIYYSEIKLNPSLALLAKFEAKLNWYEIKDSINQKTKAFINDLGLASKQDALDELVSVLINDARLLMRKYDFFEEFLSSEEIAIRNLLAGLIQLVAQKMQLETIRESWLQNSERYNNMYLRIRARLDQEENCKDYATLVLEIAECLDFYTNHKVCLTTLEQERKLSLEGLSLKVKLGFDEQLTIEKRAQDERQNKTAERNIKLDIKKLDIMLLNADAIAACDQLEQIQATAATISNPEDIENKSLIAPGYFDESLRILRLRVLRYTSRIKTEPARLAKNIMYVALKNNAFGYKNPILLERHADRLIEAIKQAFTDKWIKFEGLESAKIQKIIEDVAEIITQDLEHTTLPKRWGNWTWAELYLKNSKGLAAIVADKINHFASDIMPAYIQLPMFPQRAIEVAANSDRPVATTPELP